MKKRFILLDHSIEDSTGHYLEYAKRVLRAAKLEGFETILAVNMRAAGIVCPEADTIEKAFSSTFWGNQAQNYGKLALGLLKNCSQITGNYKYSRQFAKELRALFLRVEATADDLIFVPTLGGAELIGIALYTGLKKAQNLKWHLLFRRDLPIPNSFFDAKARLKFARVNADFTEAKNRLKTGNCFFYTDTEELTARYGKMDIWSFATLPIPIDGTLGTKKKKLTNPLVVSYLGDAREEKGIHSIPSLISTMRSTGFDEERLRFRIQANLPLDGNTSRAARTKAKLTDYLQVGVEIIEGPFDSDTYHQLVLTSDVILIPYCPRSYAARSSGIFAEALAAGIPTIYPEGSWMAKSRVGGGSLGFKKVADIPSVLTRIISNYAEYESQSIAYSSEWRNLHSARILVRRLVDRSSYRKYCFSDTLETFNGNL